MKVTVKVDGKEFEVEESRIQKIRFSPSNLGENYFTGYSVKPKSIVKQAILYTGESI